MNTRNAKKIRNGILLLAVLAVFTAGMPFSAPANGAGIQVSTANAQSTTGTATTGSTPASTASQPVTPTNCSFGWTNLGPIFSPTCWGRTIGAIVSGVLVFIAGWVLTIAGSLFDFTLNATVLSFGTLVNSNVITAINAAWSAFRDISNIVIIAMFTFIAISTILGSHDFHAKQMVSKVLIVAVLINFSLLFTKIIIDVSNFMAIQFYAAAVTNNPNYSSVISQSASAGSASQTQAQSPGIADAFMAYAGVSGFTDTRQAVSNLADSIQDGNVAFLHGVFVAIVLLAAAIVLFYGSFLLISRGLLMIFLMITSSIAFATYLVPKAASSRFGWSTWWESLLKNAIFAPLLMVLLGISLTVGNAVKAQSGTLGDLLANPTKTLDVNALFGYIIVIGLLFISFKTASSFSKGISGFDYASIVPAFAYGLAGRAVGFAGRQTIGRGSAVASEWMQAQSKDQDRSWLSRSLFDLGAQGAKFGTKRDFNVANSTLGKEIAGVAGLKGKWAGQTDTKGFEGWEKRLKESAAERGERMSHSESEIKKMREEATKAAASAVAGEKSKLVADQTKTEKDRTTLEKNVEAMRTDRNAVAEEMSKQLGQLQQERKNLNTVVTNTGSTQASTRLKEVDEEIVRLAQKRTELDQQDLRIKQAGERAGDLTTRGSAIGRDIAALEKRQVDIAKSMLPKGVTLEGSAKELAKGLKEAASVTAAHQRMTNIPARAVSSIPGVKQYYSNTEENDRIARSMRKEVSDREKNKATKEMLKQLNKLNEENKEHHVREDNRERRHEARTEEKLDNIAEHTSHPNNHH